MNLCQLQIDLMIPQSRHFNHNTISLNEDIEKVILIIIDGQLTSRHLFEVELMI